MIGLSSVFEKFPWKKDKELFEEAAQLFAKRQYENYVIYRFGGDAETARRDIYDTKGERIDLVFRDGYPDAILYNVDTEEALKIEFEEYSSSFKAHGHDPEKCDLIVCFNHDWKEVYPNEKCPLPVYEIGGKYFPKDEVSH